MPKRSSVRKKVTTTGLSPADVAAMLEISEDTVYRWARAGAPHEKRAGKLVFDLKAVRDWHVARRGGDEPGKMGRPSAVDSAPADVKERIALATLRKTVASAERIEFELAVKREEFVKAAEVEAASVRRLALVKAVLLAIPARASARCANRTALEVEAFVREEVEGALAALSGAKVEASAA